MKFSFLALASLTLSQTIPVPSDQVEQLNQLISDAILPDVNTKISTGLADPLPNVASGSQTSSKNIRICNAETIINYNVANLKGLSHLLIEELKVTSALTNDDNTKSIMKVTTSIAKLDIQADLTGSAQWKCGFLRPKVGINGSVFAKQVDITITLDAVVDSNDGLVVTGATISNVDFEFSTVTVDLKRLPPWADNILNQVLKGVEKTFRKQISDLADGLIKKQIQNLANKNLPFKAL